MKTMLCIVIIIIAAMILLIRYSMQGNVIIELIGGKQLEITQGEKRATITNEKEIKKIVAELPEEVERINKCSDEENTYNLTFIYNDDEQLDISIVDKNTVIYNGWKCRTIDKEINVDYLKKALKQNE